jgi:site-specific DNA recombinase
MERPALLRASIVGSQMIGSKPVRCAIYTRKSSEEGLEQAYNSLDAQRDACSAYILSQAGERWTLADGIFDDGGYSGGTLDRPALTRLLADIEARRIDVIVVYKVDRLTRSLADFARIIEVLDRCGASFVSVTQAFNTTTSMGRLTLNVLLSFAQFEREVTGERIRDKIASSKKLGMWMGGCVPLGYSPNERTLAIHPEEADQVRYIFHRYLDLGSVNQLRADLTAHGITSKKWVSRAGKSYGGRSIGRGALYHLLRNRLYVGEVPHKGAHYPGRHPPIVDRDLFEAVQVKLDETAVVLRLNRPKPHAKPYSGAPLAGLIFDAAGSRMSPVSARRAGGVTYRYYVSHQLQTGTRADRKILQRVPAGPLEDIVVDRLRRIGWLPDAGDQRNWSDVRARLTRIDLDTLAVVIRAVPPTDSMLLDPQPLRDRLRLGDTIEVFEAGVTLKTGACFSRRSGTLVTLNPNGGDATECAHHDRTLGTALLRAEAWKRRIFSGKAKTVEEIAQGEGVTPGYVTRILRVAFLAPDLKRSILDARQPPGLALQRLITQDLPLDWQQQRDLFRT